MRSIREAMDILGPAVVILKGKGYKSTLEANETDDTVTLTLVVHTKWPTT